MENKTKEDLNILKEALYDTASVHSINQASGALENLIKKNDFNCFTRTNDVRKNLMELGAETVKDTAIKKYVELVINDPKNSNNPFEEAMKRTYLKYKDDPRIDEFGTIELLIKKCLNEGINTFTRDGNARQNLDNFYMNSKLNLSDIVARSIAKKVTDNLILEKENEKNNATLTISNVQTYPNNIEQLRSEIISGTRLKNEGTIYLGNELQACSSIGNIRKNQEDAVLLIKHPLNPEFKMMVVADGMGGFEQGEEASNIVVSEMKNWFDSVDVSYFENMSNIHENLGQALQIVSNEIYSKFGGKAGATYVGAIIGKNETLISNIGDSRAYAVNDMNLQRITEDHSYVEGLLKQGRIRNSADTRFHKENNKITQYMGMNVGRPNFYTLQNSDYDSILLLSDGITDLLADEQLFAITRYTDKERLAQTLVREALTTNAIKPSYLSSSEYNDYIPAGKDNTTAAVFTKGSEKGSTINGRYQDDGMER